MQRRRHDRGSEGIETAGQISVSHRRHDCSATTKTACELGFIDRDTFLDQIDHSPSVWFSVLQLLSQDVNSCYDCMRNITAAR